MRSGFTSPRRSLPLDQRSRIAGGGAAGDPRGIKRRSRGIDRDTRIAVVVATLALLAVLASRASAEPLDDAIRAELAPALPAGLGIARIYLPAGLAALDVARTRISLDLPRELRPGRPSIKLTVRGRAPVWIPVVIAPLVDVAIARRALAAGDVIDDADLAIEQRAAGDGAPAAAHTAIGATVRTAIAEGAVIGAHDVTLSPPLARGTLLAIDVRRGAVHVRGSGTLELAARPGEPATARLTATHGLVRGRLVAPATLIVGDAP